MRNNSNATQLRLEPLPTIERRLPNGLQVVYAPSRGLSYSAASLFVRSGSRFETPRSNGVSHLLEHMVFRGCASLPDAHQLNLAIEELGGNLDAATRVDFTSYELEVPSENLIPAFEHLARMMTTPLLQGIDIEKRIIREELLEELNDENTQVDVDNIVRGAMFESHPLSMPIAGSIHSVDALRTADVRKTYARDYVGANAVLVIAGEVDVESIASIVEREFATMPEGSRRTTKAPREWKGNSRLHYVTDAGSQSDVRISFRVSGTNHPDRAAIAMLGRILDSGMSTRVHHTICETKGLAYEAFSVVDLYEDCGAFDFGASVAHENVVQVIGAFFELIDDVVQNGITQAELERAQLRNYWGLRAIRDHAAETAHHVGVSALFDLSWDLAVSHDHVMNVTRDDVQRIAQKYLRRSAAHVGCVGNLDDYSRTRLRSLVD